MDLACMDDTCFNAAMNVEMALDILVERRNLILF
jgi:hypothetical protein